MFSYLPLNIVLRRGSVRYGALAGVIAGAAGAIRFGPRGLLAAPPAALMTTKAILFVKQRAGARRWLDRHAECVAVARAGNVDAVFIGDCLTERWMEEGFDAWQGLVKEVKAENFGSLGDTTVQLLWRLQDGELDRDHPPSVVVVWTGANDITYGEEPAAIARAISDVATHVLEATEHTRLLVLGVPPRGWKPNVARIRSQEANALLAGDYREHPRVTFIDPTDALVEPDGSIQRSVMYDGMHLTADGYARVAPLIAPTLEAAGVAAARS